MAFQSAAVSEFEEVTLNLIREFNDELNYYRDDYADINNISLKSESNIAALRATSVLEENRKI
ncbi:MAG: hypothetical protein ACI88U_001887 [Porticoccaceae bacterium]